MLLYSTNPRNIYIDDSFLSSKHAEIDCLSFHQIPKINSQPLILHSINLYVTTHLVYLAFNSIVFLYGSGEIIQYCLSVTNGYEEVITLLYRREILLRSSGHVRVLGARQFVFVLLLNLILTGVGVGGGISMNVRNRTKGGREHPIFCTKIQIVEILCIIS